MMNQLIQAAEQGDWVLLNEKERSYRQQLAAFLEQVKRGSLVVERSDVRDFYVGMDALTSLCKNRKRELMGEIGGINRSQKQVRAYLTG